VLAVANEASALDKMADCPVMATVRVIGGKWKPRILWHLREGPAAFGELRRAVGASERMLARSLRELEACGLVTRRVIPVGGVMTTEYAYSSYGRSLIPVLDAMGQWGLAHQAQGSRD
jgi:DNA-binding HxlR family transcriptional regulator